MDDWELNTEEFSDEIFVPVLDFTYKSAGRRVFSIDTEEHIPSDEETSLDLSILEFPKLGSIQKERFSTVSCTETQEFCTFALHLLVFQGNLEAISSMWKISNEEYLCCINLVDLRGNTPLMLAAKLVASGKVYEKIFKFLLFHDADTSIKDLAGWTILDEAISQKNKSICSCLFDCLYEEKMRKWKRNKHLVLEALQRLPNFYMEIRWEFSSSVIPLVGRILPHDVCKFWKFGNCFRIDTTLVGWKNLRSKRRNMSFFFRPKDVLTDIHEEIFIVNNNKQCVVRPFAPLDPEEKNAVVGDIINTEPMQGDVNLLSYKVKPCMNWRNKQSTQKVGKWDTYKNKISYKGQMKYKKKSKNLGPCKESDYFNIDTCEDSTPTFDFPSSNEQTRTIVKKSKAFVWLSNDFPFSLKDFLPILQMVGESNKSIKKLYNFLSDPRLMECISPNSFPVKVDIPLSMTVKGTVTFDKFQIIQDASPLDLPKYEILSRKVAQKIMTCPKKRLFLANLVI